LRTVAYGNGWMPTRSTPADSAVLMLTSAPEAAALAELEQIAKTAL